MSGASERAAARDEQRRLAEALENNAREQRESREAERVRAQQERADREERRVANQVSDVHKTDMPKELESLDSETNHDEWEDGIDNFMYSLGRSDIMEASRTDPVRRINDQVMHPAVRRAMFGRIYSSLGQPIKTQVRAVRKGEIESLLAAVRSLFIQKNPATRQRLRSRLDDAKLDHHADLPSYIAYIDQTVAKYTACGGTGYDGENKIHILLKGLPKDYEVQCTAIKQQQMLNPNLSWQHVTTLLLSAVQADPSMPGSIHRRGPSKKGGAVAHIAGTDDGTETAQPKPVCRNYKAGNCKWGDRCQYRHIGPPGTGGTRDRQGGQGRKCHVCKSTGHLMKDCPMAEQFRQHREMQQQAMPVFKLFNILYVYFNSSSSSIHNSTADTKN